MSPFTPEVSASISALFRAISDVEVLSSQLAKDLTALTTDLVTNMEDQMLLVFANVGFKRKEDERELLRRQQEDQSLLEYYQSIVGVAATLEQNPETRKIEVHGKTRKMKPMVSTKALLEDAGHIPSSGDAATLSSPHHHSDDQSGGSGPTGKDSAQKSLLTAAHLMLESVGYQLQCERTMLFLSQKGTGTLRVIASAPDVKPARHGAFIAAHQGIAGAAFSTGIAVRGDSYDDETRKTYVAPIDKQLSQNTHNSIAFPVNDPATGAPVAVIECANKVRGQPFTVADEALLHHACTLMWYVLCYHDVDFFNGMTFLPTALHALRPFRPAAPNAASVALDKFHGAAGARRTQLVVRIAKSDAPPDGRMAAISSKNATPSLEEGGADQHNNSSTKQQQGANATTSSASAAAASTVHLVPAAVKGRNQAPPEGSHEVAAVHNVRELRSYLTQLEGTHRHVMNDVVQARDREAALQEELSKKAHRVRLLEENAQFLHEGLMEAKMQLNAKSFAPIESANFMGFADDGTGAPLSAAQGAGSSPTRAGATPLKQARLGAFLQNANEVQQLQQSQSQSQPPRALSPTGRGSTRSSNTRQQPGGGGAGNASSSTAVAERNLSFITTASRAIAKLKSSALAEVSPAVISRSVALAPQPGSPVIGGGMSSTKKKQARIALPAIKR